jgi:hypothetical protein
MAYEKLRGTGRDTSNKRDMIIASMNKLLCLLNEKNIKNTGKPDRLLRDT